MYVHYKNVVWSAAALVLKIFANNIPFSFALVRHFRLLLPVFVHHDAVVGWVACPRTNSVLTRFFFL
jgi:hypothetical protein